MGKITDDILENVKNYIKESANKQLKQTDLAKRFDVDKKYLHYQFKIKYGISLKDFHNNLKWLLLLRLLKEKNGRLYKTSFEIAVSLGYQNDSGLQKFIHRKTGMFFKDYQEKVNKD
ncbi:MAG: helix-turn-helix transcriptional regulator [bacterium]|nr:helix-turn-helix transcriptional regulator [bacterium]